MCVCAWIALKLYIKNLFTPSRCRIPWECNHGIVAYITLCVVYLLGNMQLLQTWSCNCPWSLMACQFFSCSSGPRQKHVNSKESHKHPNCAISWEFCKGTVEIDEWFVTITLPLLEQTSCFSLTNNDFLSWTWDVAYCLDMKMICYHKQFICIRNSGCPPNPCLIKSLLILECQLHSFL